MAIEAYPARPGRMLVTALCAMAITGTAAAQEHDVRTSSGTRPFATPQYWLNATPDDRLPIRERALTRTPGVTNLAPPPFHRSGLTPRLGFAVEARAADDGLGGSDTILTFAPGLNYTRSTARWRLDADYTVETAQHLEQTNLSKVIGNHGGFVNFGYDVTPQTQFTVFEGYASTQDTSNALVAGVLAPDTVLSGNNLQASLAHRINPRAELEIAYTNQLQFTNQAAQTDIFSNEVTAEGGYFLTERDRLRGRVRASWFDFDLGGNDNVEIADVVYTRDFGDRLALSAGMGILHTSAEGGRTVPSYNAELVTTMRNIRFSLEASRDIESTPGLNGLLLSDQITGAVHIRLAKGLQLKASVEQQWMDLLDGSGIDIAVTTLEGQLSYAVDDRLWVWTRLYYSQESSGGTRLQDSRLYVGISRSFDF